MSSISRNENLIQAGGFLEYSTLNKNLNKEHSQNVLSLNLKKTLAPSTLSQTKDAYLSNKSNNNNQQKQSFQTHLDLFTHKRSLVKTKSSDNLIKTSRSNSHLNIYEKSKEYIELHNRKIEEQRNNKQMLELNHMKPYVKMNDNSRTIINNKHKRSNSSFDNNSINKELPNYMKNTKIKENNIIHLKELIDKENAKIKSRNHSNKNIKKGFSQEKFQLFIKKNENMIKNKKQRELMKKQIELNEIQNACSFNPQINKNSIQIANSLNVSISEPETRREKRKLMIRSKSFIKKEYDKLSSMYNFTPKTNLKKEASSSKIKNVLNEIKQNKQNIKGYKFQLKDNLGNIHPKELHSSQTQNNNNKTGNQYNKYLNNIYIPKKIKPNNTRNCNFGIKNSKTEIVYNFELEQNNVSAKNNHNNDSVDSLYKLNTMNNLPKEEGKTVIKYNAQNNGSLIKIVKTFI